jgi:hypothetical protein
MLRIAIAAGLLLAPAAAAAKIESQGPNGFAVVHEGSAPIPPDALWKLVAAPNRWWTKAHSWTGDAENFFLDPQAGGCFCERIRATEDGKIVNRGSVEHMRVIYADPGKVLRLSGALGPLQSEAVTGTLTIAVAPDGAGSKFSFAYVVGGYMRYKPEEIAPAVDAVIGEQAAALAKLAAPAG